MPKHTIKHAPGAALQGDVRTLLAKVFRKEEIEKLETLGGTVEFIMSTTPRGIKKKPNQQVDQAYVQALRNLVQNGGDLRKELASLNRKQLQELCRKIELPASSHITNRQLISAVESRLLSPGRWQQIIEHKPHSPGTS